MAGQTIADMRSRVARCRALAAGIGDERARGIPLQTADEGQADIDRLLAEKGE
jgi:hypothetical protein